MARLTAISGVGGKLPAAFLLEIEGKRLLLDLGEGPEPGVFPSVEGIGAVDAICLSHAHVDHAGALHLADDLGDPPVYATRTTFDSLGSRAPKATRRRILPVSGAAEIAGVPVTLGRCGHAPGGVWFHFPHAGGILYTGDWSVESGLLPFDPPPPARLLVTDASYGDRDTNLADQIDAIARMAAAGAVLPVPGGGRGPEMAMALAARGLRPRVCPQVLREMQVLAGDDLSVNTNGRQALRDFLAGTPGGDWRPTDIVVAAEANAEAGLSAALLHRLDEGFRFIFSGHVPRNTPAHGLLATGRATWLPWNVHPRRRDVLELAARTGASRVVPAFVEPDAMPQLGESLGKRLLTDRTIALASPAEHGNG